MIARAGSTGLWIVSSSLLIWAVSRYAGVGSDLWSVRKRRELPAVVQLRDPPNADSLGNAAERATRLNPFRPDRSFADSSAAAPGVPAPNMAPNAGAQLSVRGILGGPPWIVVLQGLPGAPNAVVLRSGDTIAGFSLMRVRRDTVWLRGPQSQHTLTLSAR